MPMLLANTNKSRVSQATGVGGYVNPTASAIVFFRSIYIAFFAGEKASRAGRASPYVDIALARVTSNTQQPYQDLGILDVGGSY
jgi:hypothetical protein